MLEVLLGNETAALIQVELKKGFLTPPILLCLKW